MSFMKGDLLPKTRKLMKGGIMARSPMAGRCHQPKKTRCHRAPNIKLPEDRLVESYYARHPEAKIIPFEQVEFEAAEKAELEALKAERWHAIWEGREPPPLKLTKIEDV
ncbi:unnamed protein product [Sphagnum jensenii]